MDKIEQYKVIADTKAEIKRLREEAMDPDRFNRYESAKALFLLNSIENVLNKSWNEVYGEDISGTNLPRLDD